MELMEGKILKMIFQHKVILSIIIISSFLVKLYYLPFELPVTADALAYFGFAIDASVLKDYPEKIMPNDGWSIFLSFFFSLLPSTNFMDFMNLQRLVSIGLSTITIIPLYFIAKRFVNGHYPLIAVIIFAFEPRIIENSILGITESLYILLGTVSLWLFLTNESKKIYLAFLFASLFMIVRTEGFVLFFAFSAIFLLRNRIIKKSIRDYFISISVFLSALIPVLLIRTEKTGLNHVFDRIEEYSSNLISSSNTVNAGTNYFIDGTINFIKFLGWDMLPIFVFCVPVGLLVVLKNRNWDNLTILISTFIIAIPIFYIFSAGVNDSRYFYALYPIFCIFFILGLKRILKSVKNENIILLLVMIGIIISSLVFTDYRKMDVEHENEALLFANIVIDKTQVVNAFWPESKFIPISTISNLELFPTPISQLEFSPKIIIEKTLTLDEYLELGKANGLTHLIVDEKNYPTYRMPFLKDVFDNEEKYPYLIKQYDSVEHGFSYHAKIFKIDYSKYYEFLKSR